MKKYMCYAQSMHLETQYKINVAIYMLLSKESWLFRKLGEQITSVEHTVPLI